MRQLVISASNSFWKVGIDTLYNSIIFGLCSVAWANSWIVVAIFPQVYSQDSVKSTVKIVVPAVRTIVKPVTKTAQNVNRVVQKEVVEPIVKVTKAVPKPITRAIAKVAQVFRPQPSAKRGRKRR